MADGTEPCSPWKDNWRRYCLLKRWSGGRWWWWWWRLTPRAGGLTGGGLTGIALTGGGRRSGIALTGGGLTDGGGGGC